PDMLYQMLMPRPLPGSHPAGKVTEPIVDQASMMRPGTTLFTLLCVCLCAPLPAAAQSGDGRSQSNSAPVIASPVLPRPRPAQQPHPTDIDRVTADKPVVDHDAGNNNGNDDGNNDGKAARP